MIIRSYLFIVFMIAIAAVAAAQTEPALNETTAKPFGLRQEVLKEFDSVEEKLVGLAKAIPAEKYSWRPAEGVRSISEVFMHVASSNYALPRYVGADPPEGKTDLEKITDKDTVVKSLEESFDHIRAAVGKVSDGELQRMVKFFDGDRSISGVLFLITNHLHEHLGQMIAYARMNGVVPPWSSAG